MSFTVQLTLFSLPPPLVAHQLESSNWQVDVRLSDGVHSKVATPSALLDLHVVDDKTVGVPRAD